MLRHLFITLSHSQAVRRFMIHFGPARRAARRFIAGETLDEGIGVVRELNARGILAALDHLGENVSSHEDARRAAQEYQALLRRIATEGVQSTISVKLTHVGLDFGYEFCCDTMRAILQTAGELGNTVEVDIEGSGYTQVTLDVFHCLLDDYRNLRLALQAYLFRTEEDLKGLIQRGGSVRLCKGAYDEPAEVALRRRDQVTAAYASLLAELMACEGVRPAVATHDSALVARARELARRRQQPFEFQMLYGIRFSLQAELVAAGFPVRVYLPYGVAWYPYLTRRLAERPSNVWFFALALLGH